MERKIVAFLVVIFSVNALLFATGLLTGPTAEEYFNVLPSDFNTVGFGSTSMDFNTSVGSAQKDDISNLPIIGGILGALGPVGGVISMIGNVTFGYFMAVDKVFVPLTTVEQVYGEDCSNSLDDNNNGLVNEYCDQAAMNSILKLLLAPIGVLQVLSMAYLFFRLVGVIVGSVRG